MWRVFFAISPPAAWVDAIGAIQWGPRGVRWVLPDQLHLTVRFLSERQPAEVARWVAQLPRLRWDPMALELFGTGHFPPRGAPRVLWAGVRDPAPLLRLRQELDRWLVALGVSASRERYRPHLTVGRIAGAADEDLAGWLNGHGLFATDPCLIPALHLMRSVAAGPGREYVRLASVRPSVAALGG